MRTKKPVNHFAPYVTQARELARKMLRPRLDEISRKIAKRFGVELYAVRQHVGYVADDELVDHIVRALDEGSDYWEEFAAEQGRSPNDALAVVATAYARFAQKKTAGKGGTTNAR